MQMDCICFEWAQSYWFCHGKAVALPLSILFQLTKVSNIPSSESSVLSDLDNVLDAVRSHEYGNVSRIYPCVSVKRD